MVVEEEFLKEFRKNCKERIKTKKEANSVRWRLKSRECPFPEVCRDASGIGRRCGCLSNDIMSHNIIALHICPISKKWQDQVLFFHTHKAYLNLLEKMLKIVKEVS